MPNNKDGSRIGDWMVTFTGQKFYPLDPRPEEVHIEDIAHALAINNRYNGHTIRPYSVGHHSILCSYYVEEGHELMALLHDATEAYLADVVRPAKRGMPEYMEIENRLYENAIAPKFGLSKTLTKEVHIVDNRMLVTEARQLLNDKGPKWWEEEHWPVPFGGLIIEEIPWQEVEIWFLDRFKELMRNV